jgi:hypothetical protein
MHTISTKIPCGDEAQWAKLATHRIAAKNIADIGFFSNLMRL